MCVLPHGPICKTGEAWRTFAEGRRIILVGGLARLREAIPMVSCRRHLELLIAGRTEIHWNRPRSVSFRGAATENALLADDCSP